MKFLIVSVVFIIVLTSCGGSSVLNPGNSKKSLDYAKIITVKNDTIEGQFKELSDNKFEYLLKNGENIIYCSDEIKYIHFHKDKYPFVRLDELNIFDNYHDESLYHLIMYTDFKSEWLELIVEGNVSLYRRHFVEGTNNPYYNGSSSFRRSYINLIRINNGYIQEVEDSFFEGNKSLKKIFSEYPDVEQAIDRYFRYESSSLKGFVKLLNTKSGRIMLANKEINS